MVQILPNCTKGFNPYTAGEGEKLPIPMVWNAEGLLLNSFPVVANISLHVFEIGYCILARLHTEICRFSRNAPIGDKFTDWPQLICIAARVKK